MTALLQAAMLRSYLLYLLQSTISQCVFVKAVMVAADPGFGFQ